MVSSLPQLIDETQSQLASCNARLAAIPPITSEPFAFILDLVQGFCAKVRGQVQGGVDAVQVVQDSMAVYRNLRAGIRCTAPLFVPYTDSQLAFVPNIPLELQQLEDGEEGLPSIKTTKQITITEIQTKIRRCAPCLCVDPSRLLNTISDTYSARTRELPNNVPYTVKLMLIKEFQSDWEKMVLRAYEQVFNILKTYTTSLITVHFGKYGHLNPRVRYVLKSVSRAAANFKPVVTLWRHLWRLNVPIWSS